MRIFKTYEEQLKEDIQYGFGLAIRWAELGKKYGEDPVEFMKKKLRNWDGDDTE